MIQWYKNRNPVDFTERKNVKSFLSTFSTPAFDRCFISKRMFDIKFLYAIITFADV